MRIRVLSFVALTAACAHTTPPQTRAFILGGHRAGEEKVTVSGSTRTIDFEYNDRGRGPKTHTVLTTDAHALTASLSNDGNDYFKAPVAETFANGAWANGAERGKTPAIGSSFYVSMYGPPRTQSIQG